MKAVIPLLCLLSVALLAEGLQMEPASLSFEQSLNQSFSGQVRVRNNGTSTLTGITVQLVGLQGYAVSFSPVSFGLAPGTDQLVVFSGRVPLDASDGVFSGYLQAAAQGELAAAGITVSIPSMLSITGVNVGVRGRSSGSLHDGDTIAEEARPENTITIDVRVGNRYTDAVSERIGTIDDVTVTATLKDVDDGDDFEDEQSLSLNRQQAKTASFRFSLPRVIESGDYDLRISVDGEDGSNRRWSDRATLVLRVTKESNSVQIKSAALEDGTLACDRSTSIAFEIWNLGSSDEEKVFYSVRNKALGYVVFEGPIEMSADPDDDTNHFRRSFPVRLNQSVTPGVYPLEIRVYYDTNILSDYTSLPLTVERCVSGNGQRPGNQTPQNATGAPANQSAAPPSRQVTNGTTNGAAFPGSQGLGNRSVLPGADSKQAVRLIDLEQGIPPSIIVLLLINALLIVLIVVLLARKR